MRRWGEGQRPLPYLALKIQCWLMVDRKREPMVGRGSWLLGEFPLPLVRVKCDKCGRVGQYHTAKLIEQHGADMVMPELRHIIAKCPRRHTMNDPCMIVFVDRVER